MAGIQRTITPFSGNFYDSHGKLRNIDGHLVVGDGFKNSNTQLNGDFYDHAGNIRNLDSLLDEFRNGGSGGGPSEPAMNSLIGIDYDDDELYLILTSSSGEVFDASTVNVKASVGDLDTPAEISFTYTSLTNGEYIWKANSTYSTFLGKVWNFKVYKAGESEYFYTCSLNFSSSTISTTTVVWDIERHTLTAGDISNKYFDLTQDISTSDINKTFIAVDTDIQGIDDFEAVTPKRISWNGKGLDGFMQAGMLITVFYPTVINALVGPPGPPGPPGTGGGGGTNARYEHTQATPNTTWNVQHNFGLTPSAVMIRNSLGEYIHGYLDFSNSTNNLLSLKFSEPLTGTAIVTG